MTSRTTQKKAQAEGSDLAAAKGRPVGLALAQPRPGRGRRASAPRNEEARIAELKVKLRDDDYMNGAILRIATVLSARLTLR